MDKFITKGRKVVDDHSASAFSNKIIVAADVHTDVEGLEVPVTKKVKKEKTTCMPRYFFVFLLKVGYFLNYIGLDRVIFLET